MRFALHFTNTFPEEGGGYTFETEIINAWLKAKSHNEAWFCSHNFLLAKNIERVRARYISLRTGSFERWSWKLKNERRRLLRLFGWPSPAPFPSVNSMIAAKRLRAQGVRFVWHLSQWTTPVVEMPYAMTIWDLQHRVQPYFPEVSAEGNWQGREKHFCKAIQRASVVITGTERGKHEIERFYGVDSDRIRVIPLPTPSFALGEKCDDGQDILKDLNLPERYIFYPAQFWSHKNHIVLLDVVRLLQDRLRQSIAIVFAGHDHGNLSYIRAAADELGVSKSVHFLGFVSQQQLKALYREAIALVFPSYFGPDNLPPLEAFAFGCPVIAAGVPGAEEQLGDAALRVAPSCAEAFASSVMRVLEDPVLRADLIKKGALRARSFTALEYIDAMDKILDEFAAITRCWQ